MKRLPVILTAGAFVLTLGFSAVQPAKADDATTTAVAAAAAVAGIAIWQNVQHKNQQANTVQGYTPWGATVYADGHVVLPNGQSYYPGNVGQQISCNGTACQILQNGVAVGYGGYGPNNGYGGYGGYNTGYNNYPYGQQRTGYAYPTQYNPNGQYTAANPNNYYGTYTTHRTVTHVVPVAVVDRHPISQINRERAFDHRQVERAEHHDRSDHNRD